MRLWIDCEFNSYKGQLMSLALVGEGDVQFYAVLPLPDEIDPWVQTNVVPILGAKPTPYRDAQDELETFLAAFDSVHIVADWPEDIAHFCDFLITGPGQRIDTPPLTMEVVRVDAPSKVPHNALWDAIGIRDFMLADAALSHAAGQEGEQRDMSILDKYAEVASALGFEGDAWFGDPLAGHEEIVHRAQNYADEAWTAKLRRGMDEYAEALADERAAGQEGEQCRAASVPEDIETLLDEVVIAARDDERCNDHGNLQSARRRAHDSLQDAKAQLLRALSRGVPEGNQAAVDSVIRQYCRTCGGCGEIGGHSGQTPESYEEWSAPCPDCSPAAIAAQRKEG